MKSPLQLRRRSPGVRGSVVIFVLGIILLTAFLLTRLMDRAAVELAAENRAARRAELRQEATSALDAALAVLADQAAVDQGLFDPRDGWDRPLDRLAYHPTPGIEAEVTVEDETGKLSLPLADEAKLGSYLDAIGCPATATDRLVDALLTWTRPEHISLEGEGLEFPGAPVPYRAPQRALRSFEELRAIPPARKLFFDEQGRWNELGLRFKSGASLFGFNTTNVNTACTDSLLAHGLDAAAVQRIASARDAYLSRGGALRTPAELAGAWGPGGAPPGLGTEAQCLHLRVHVRRGGIGYLLDAWVGRPGAALTVDAARAAAREPRKRLDYPFQILELRENHAP